MINLERLREVFYYSPETGNWEWKIKIPHTTNSIGDKAGCENCASNYIQIKIDTKIYLAHRLAWFYMTGEWPENEIDHINGIKNDNRWCNLREATRKQNSYNIGKKSDNTSGYKGVCFNRQNNKWRSQIKINGKKIFLGDFSTKEEAFIWYKSFSELAFGQFINNN